MEYQKWEDVHYTRKVGFGRESISQGILQMCALRTQPELSLKRFWGPSFFLSHPQWTITHCSLWLRELKQPKKKLMSCRNAGSSFPRLMLHALLGSHAVLSSHILTVLTLGQRYTNEWWEECANCLIDSKLGLIRSIISQNWVALLELFLIAKEAVAYKAIFLLLLAVSISQ